MKQKFKIIKFLLLALVPCVILFSAISYAVEPHYEVRFNDNDSARFKTLPELLSEYKELLGKYDSAHIFYVSERGKEYILSPREGSFAWVGPQGEIGHLNSEGKRLAALESKNQQEGEWHFLPLSPKEKLMLAHQTLRGLYTEARTFQNYLKM